MGKRQKRVENKRIGNDTYVRNMYDNMFQTQAAGTFQMIPAEIFLPQPEPIFKQGMVTVKPVRGGQISAVAYPNAFIDPITRNLNGLHEGLIPGQMVMVGFSDGNRHAPFVVNRFPYQARGNALTETAYINPLTQKGWSSQDTMLGHFSGSYLRFATLLPLPGSTQLYSVTDLELETNTFVKIKAGVQIEHSSINIKSVADVMIESEAQIIKMTGKTHIELNGNTNFAVNFTEMQTAFNTLRTELNNLITVYNAHVHTCAAPGFPSTSPLAPAVPAVADMSAAKNMKVLL
jgi:hypothetical protein